MLIHHLAAHADSMGRLIQRDLANCSQVIPTYTRRVFRKAVLLVEHANGAQAEKEKAAQLLTRLLNDNAIWNGMDNADFVSPGKYETFTFFPLIAGLVTGFRQLGGALGINSFEFKEVDLSTDDEEFRVVESQDYAFEKNGNLFYQSLGEISESLSIDEMQAILTENTKELIRIVAKNISVRDKRMRQQLHECQQCMGDDTLYVLFTGTAHFRVSEGLSERHLVSTTAPDIFKDLIPDHSVDFDLEHFCHLSRVAGQVMNESEIADNDVRDVFLQRSLIHYLLKLIEAGKDFFTDSNQMLADQASVQYMAAVIVEQMSETEKANIVNKLFNIDNPNGSIASETLWLTWGDYFDEKFQRILEYKDIPGQLEIAARKIFNEI